MSKKHEQGGAVLKSAAEIALERKNHPAAESPDPATEQAEEVSLPKQELESLRAQAAKAQENWDRLLRAQADLENYRKGGARERQDLLQTASENLLRDLLTPLDHFEMGLETSQQASATDSLREGIRMVFEQFHQFLKTHGVTEIQTVGQPFNPALHEAVNHQESDAPEGQVIQQLRKGYRLHNKMLRPATVVVSSGKAGALAASLPSETAATNPVPGDHAVGQA